MCLTSKDVYYAAIINQDRLSIYKSAVCQIDLWPIYVTVFSPLISHSSINPLEIVQVLESQELLCDGLKA